MINDSATPPAADFPGADFTTTLPATADFPAAATTARWRAAVEARDLERFMATLAPDVVVHSPLTDRTQFQGHEDVRTLILAVFATIHDIHYTHDIGDAHTRALVYTARVGRQRVQEATLLRLDDDALVAEVTFWFRPLPGLTALAATLVPGLARARSRPRALLLRLLATPLAWVTRGGDRLGVWLAR
jgi:SnoaL-like domain